MSILSDHIQAIAKAHFPTPEAINPSAVDQYTADLVHACLPGTQDSNARTEFIQWLRHLANTEDTLQDAWNMAAFHMLRKLKYQHLLHALMRNDDDATVIQALQEADATMVFAEHHGIHRVESALNNPEGLLSQLPWQLGFASLERKGQTKDGQHWVYTAKPWVMVYMNADHQRVAQLFAQGSFDRTRSESLCGLVNTAVQLHYQGRWLEGGAMTVNLHLESTGRTTFSQQEKKALIDAATLAHAHGMQLEMEGDTLSAQAMRAWQSEMATRELEDGELHLFRPRDMLEPPKAFGIFQYLREEARPLLKSLASRIAHALLQADSTAKTQLLGTLSQQARERIDQNPCQGTLNGPAKLFLWHLVIHFQGNLDDLPRLLAARCQILDARYTDETEQLMLTFKAFKAYIQQWQRIQMARRERLPIQDSDRSDEMLAHLCRRLRGMGIPHRNIQQLRDAHNLAIDHIDKQEGDFERFVEALGTEVNAIESLFHTESRNLTEPASQPAPQRGVVIEELASDDEDDDNLEAAPAPEEVTAKPTNTSWRDRFTFFGRKQSPSPSGYTSFAQLNR